VYFVAMAPCLIETSVVKAASDLPFAQLLLKIFILSNYVKSAKAQKAQKLKKRRSSKNTD